MKFKNTLSLIAIALFCTGIVNLSAMEKSSEKVKALAALQAIRNKWGHGTLTIINNTHKKISLFDVGNESIDINPNSTAVYPVTQNLIKPKMPRVFDPSFPYYTTYGLGDILTKFDYNTDSVRITLTGGQKSKTFDFTYDNLHNLDFTIIIGNTIEDSTILR